MNDDRPRRRSSGPHEAGTIVGAYKLVRQLDRGGMAEVWIAKNVGTGRAEKHVALKFIAPHLADDKRYRRLFRAEAEVAMMLNHANIVQVFGFDESYEIPYLVMEWVDGINLRKVRDSLAAVTEDRRIRIACYVVEQLLHGLRYAHGIVTHQGQEVGLVHRDVTPQNVLVSNSAEVKLTDFGVAATSFEETSGVHVKGKIRYMAPEQVSGHSREKTVDLYAAGTLFHELLEGERFRGGIEDDRELYTAVLEGEIPETSCELPDVIEELRCGLLEPDPAQRIQSADEALELLCIIPRVGDPRRDLMRLCTGLTGVVQPRSGPGTSSMHTMAGARRGTKRAVTRRRRASVPPVSTGARAEDGTLADDEVEVDGRARARSDGSAAEPSSARQQGPAPVADRPVAEISITEPLSQGSLPPPPQQPAAAPYPAENGSFHLPRVSTIPAGYEARPPTAPVSVVPPNPAAASWAPVDHGVSAPIELDPTSVDNGAGTQASWRPPAKRRTGLAPLLVVAGIVLVATTATVTWLLANPELEPRASTKAIASKMSETKNEGAPDPPADDSSGGLGTGADGGATGVVDDATGTGGDTGKSGDEATGEAGSTNEGGDGNARGAVQPEPKKDPPPPPPTMTIRVARKKETGPLWVWVGGRWYSIDNPPYRVIPKVPEGSYVYWNTTKTKKSDKKQKIGKRKKGKIWNLVITPTGTQEMYLDA
jgi:serine/threonine protein kinase